MSKTIVQPYLFFAGRGDEAIEFYRSAIKAEVCMIIRYKESPEPPQMEMPAGWGEKIMHASLNVGDTGFSLSDGCGADSKGFEGFSLSYIVQDEAEAKRAFEALSAGGQANMPLTKTFFSPAFGMLQDKFGISWMIMVRPAA